MKRREAVTQERDAFCAQLCCQERDTLATQFEAVTQERDLFAQQIHAFEIKVAVLEALDSELKRRLGRNSQNSFQATVKRRLR